MASSGRHVCMVPEGPGPTQWALPAAGCSRICSRLRRLLLAAGWHRGALTFLRSRRSLQRERARHTATYPLVWHPYSPIKFGWDVFKLAVVLAAFVYMPLNVFVRYPDPADGFVLFCDTVALLDIFTNFFTGTVNKDDKSVMLEPSKIAVQYLKGTFIVDLIGALPLQLLPVFPHNRYPTHTITFVLKLFRIGALRRAWKNLFYQIDLSYTTALAMTIMMRTAFFFHWTTYFHYQVPALCANVFEHSGSMLVWLQRFRLVGEAEQSSVLDKYITNLYDVVGLCIGAGLKDPEHTHVIPDLLLASSIGLVGLLFIAYSFTGLLRLMVYKYSGSYLYNGRLKELHAYFRFHRLPRSLQQKIQLFLNYNFNGHYFNESSIVNTINEPMKQEINMHCCKRLVVNVPLFQDMPIALINTIIFSLTQVLYMPGELVVKCGNPGSSLYLIASGTVAVMNSANREVAHLKDGASFGERALLSPGSPRVATIVALEITEIYKLNSATFLSCMQTCPRLKRRLQEAALRRHQRWANVHMDQLIDPNAL